MDKALIAWGVKSPPGEPEVDIKEKIKSAGLAGALAYGGTELAFWVISVPLAVFGYHETTGEWLDLTSLEGKEKVGGYLRCKLYERRTLHESLFDVPIVSSDTAHTRDTSRAGKKTSRPWPRFCVEAYPSVGDAVMIGACLNSIIVFLVECEQASPSL